VKKEWVGNPAKSAAVEDMLEACKNKDGEGERKHSRAMSIEDMQKLHDNYLKNCPVIDPLCDLNLNKSLEAEDIKKRATYLLFNALSTLAFIIWMR
jgi:antirestriction protein